MSNALLESTDQAGTFKTQASCKANQPAPVYMTSSCHVLRLLTIFLTVDFVAFQHIVLLQVAIFHRRIIPLTTGNLDDNDHALNESDPILWSS